MDCAHPTEFESAGVLPCQAHDHHRHFIFDGFSSDDTTGTKSSAIQPQHEHFVAYQKRFFLDNASGGRFNNPNSQLHESHHASDQVHNQDTSQACQPASNVGCGVDDPTAWFDLATFLGEAPESLEGGVSGHESDGSGCSASSRIREELLQSDSLPNWYCSTTAVQSSLEPVLPDQDMPEFSEEDLRMCLSVACQGLGVDVGQPADASEGGLVCSNGAATSMVDCLNLAAPITAPLLRASSTNSSVNMPPLLGPAPGTVKGQACGLPGLCMQQSAKLDGVATSKGANRKRGRPRRYDTTLPLLPGAMEAQAAAAMAGHINGVDSEKRKRTRGAKPKYHFVTAEEAIAHRRERNRITALASYEKRKAHQDALRSEIEQLEQDQAALRQLLSVVQHPSGDKRLVRELLMKPDASMCEVVQIVSSTMD